MADIFISYSQKDREIAKSLADFLVDCGYDLWWDYELVGGVKFRSEIKTKLEGAKAAIVIWTPNSVESDWVIEEAEEAKYAGKLVATRTDALDYRDIPLGFRGVHTEVVTQPDHILRALEAMGVSPSRAPSPRKPGSVVIDKRLDAEAIAKAEQFAHWEFIKDSKDPASFTGFIEQFPTSSFVTLARMQLGKLATEAWERLHDTDDVAALSAFARDFPSDPRTTDIRKKIAALQARAEEATSWAGIKDSADIAAVEAHLAQYPDGASAAAARAMLKTLRREREIADHWRSIAQSSEPAAFAEFLSAYPDSPLVAQAQARLDEVRRLRENGDWRVARDARFPAELLAFLKDHPSGAHRNEALDLLAALPKRIEHEAWAIANDSREPTVLRGFLAAFPQGVHTAAAQSQLASLAKADGAPHRSPAPAATKPAGVVEPSRGPDARRDVRAGAASNQNETPRMIAERLLQTEFVSDAVALIESLNGTVVHQKKGGFLFNSVDLVVTVFNETRAFEGEYDMAQWSIKTIAPRVLAESESSAASSD